MNKKQFLFKDGNDLCGLLCACTSQSRFSGLCNCMFLGLFQASKNTEEGEVFGSSGGCFWVTGVSSPYVTVINRNGRCKPKFVLWFLVRLFYDQFSNRHCRSIRRLLPWITAFHCHFVMPLITTVQVPAILYILRLPRDSVIGLFRRRHPSISLRHWRLICSCFKETLSRKTLEFEGDLSIPVVLRVELSLYCLGSSYRIQMKT